MKKLVTTALSLFLLAGITFAQTAELDAQQNRLNELQAELDEAQRTALLNERSDEHSRSAYHQQNYELEVLELERSIGAIEGQIQLENERAARQAAELERIEQLRAQIAQQSEELRQARLVEYENRIAAERANIEALKQDRIAQLQAQIDAEQAQLDTLQAQMAAANQAEQQ